MKKTVYRNLDRPFTLIRNQREFLGSSRYRDSRHPDNKHTHRDGHEYIYRSRSSGCMYCRRISRIGGNTAEIRTEVLEQEIFRIEYTSFY